MQCHLVIPNLSLIGWHQQSFRDIWVWLLPGGWALCGQNTDENEGEWNHCLCQLGNAFFFPPLDILSLSHIFSCCHHPLSLLLSLYSCGFFPLTSAHYFPGIWDISPKCGFRQWVAVIQPDSLVSFITLWQEADLYKKHQNRDELEAEHRWIYTSSFHQSTFKTCHQIPLLWVWKSPGLELFFPLLFCNQALSEFRQQP